MITDERAARAWLESLPEWDSTASTRIDRLTALLKQENSRQNLVAASSLDDIWRRHIADSAQLLCHVPRGTYLSWLDLGTGAGFPGLIVAILRPDIAMVMVESRTKRSVWLQHASSTLSLVNTQVFSSRLELVEDLPMSVISARAFAPLDRLLELSARFSTDETLWLLPKGRSAAHELRELQNWPHMFHVEQSLTDRDAGIIVGRLNGKAEQCR